MSQRFGSLFVVTFLALACQSSDAKRVEAAEPVESVERGLRVATTLAPEDLGIQKWVFSDAPPVGEVMVLRGEFDLAIPDGRDRSVRELVAHTRGALQEWSVVVLREPAAPSNGHNATWTVKGCAGSLGQPGRIKSARYGPDDLQLVFDVDGGETVLRFTLRREPIEAALARYPELRKISVDATWEYSGELESGDEPQK
jgi:hypothetical protein